MGVFVNYDNLFNEVSLSNARLTYYIEIAKNSTEALEAYCNDTELRGSAYTNSKQFFSETYMLIIEQIKEICGSMIENNKKLLTEFKRIVPTTPAIGADTVVIEKAISDLRNENTMYEDKIEEYNRQISYTFFNTAYHDFGPILTWQGCITCNNIIIDYYEEVVNNLYAFNNYCASFFDDDISRIAKWIAAAIDLGKAFTDGTTHFTIPESLTSLIDELVKDEITKLKGWNCLNCDEFLKLVEKGDDLTQVELRAIYSLMYPSKECPKSLSFEDLKKQFMKDITTKIYSDVNTYQKDMMVVLYEYDNTNHAESMKKFFKDIPKDSVDHKYSDDVRNIKFILYTANEIDRKLFFNYVDDVEVVDWEYEDGVQYQQGGKLYLDLTDDVNEKGEISGVGANDKRGPYTAFFHEYFHAIDYLAAVRTAESTAAFGTRLNNDLLYNIAKGDVEDRIDKVIEELDPNGELSDIYNSVKNKIMSTDNNGFTEDTLEDEFYDKVTGKIASDINGPGLTYHKASGVSDVYEGYTNNSIDAVYGHYTEEKPDYWVDKDGNDKYLQPVEMWGHYGAARLTRNSAALRKFETFLPYATAEMDGMINDYVNGGN